MWLKFTIRTIKNITKPAYCFNPSPIICIQLLKFNREHKSAQTGAQFFKGFWKQWGYFYRPGSEAWQKQAGGRKRFQICDLTDEADVFWIFRVRRKAIKDLEAEPSKNGHCTVWKKLIMPLQRKRIWASLKNFRRGTTPWFRMIFFLRVSWQRRKYVLEFRESDPAGGKNSLKNMSSFLEPIFTNFSCGPDSILIPYFRKIMGNKPSLTLELDSHSVGRGPQHTHRGSIDISAGIGSFSKKGMLNESASDFRIAEVSWWCGYWFSRQENTTSGTKTSK